MLVWFEGFGFWFVKKEERREVCMNLTGWMYTRCDRCEARGAVESGREEVMEWESKRKFVLRVCLVFDKHTVLREALNHFL